MTRGPPQPVYGASHHDDDRRPQAEAEVGANAAAPSEAKATATSASLRNMIVSSRFRRGQRAIGEIVSRDALDGGCAVERPIV